MRLSHILSILACHAIGIVTSEPISDELVDDSARYTIEGRVYPPEFGGAENFQAVTSVGINDGEYKGFLREDGSFIISGVPSGSYVVEITNADYFYEPVRVEINPKGKFRARKVNYIQPAQIIQVPYPLKVKALTRYKYFQTRDQWKITDFLFSPMVLMMALPLLLMVLLPMVMNDAETKKEMESLNLNNMPQFGDVLTSYFTGQPPKAAESSGKQKPALKQTKKRN